MNIGAVVWMISLGLSGAARLVLNILSSMQPHNFLLYFLSYKEPSSETDTECGEKKKL
jgi:hypothetical protein